MPIQMKHKYHVLTTSKVKVRPSHQGKIELVVHARFAPPELICASRKAARTFASNVSRIDSIFKIISQFNHFVDSFATTPKHTREHC